MGLQCVKITHIVAAEESNLQSHFGKVPCLGDYYYYVVVVVVIVIISSSAIVVVVIVVVVVVIIITSNRKTIY